MGRFIVIDGLDGSGKETQAKLLCSYLEEQKIKYRYLSFPRYDCESSALVRMYLSGGLGSNPSDTNAFAASTFFAVDRYVSFRTDWKDDYLSPDTVVVANRYTTANAVHQLSKLPRGNWDSFLKWLWNYEFDLLDLPVPDEVLYLEMTPEISERLIAGRAKETGRTVDIQESVSFLKASYEAALFASEKLGWKKIKCYEDKVPLSKRAIHGIILNELGYMEKKDDN